MTYQILDKKCKLFRYVDDIRGSPKQNKVSGEIYFIGDSLNRNLVLDVGKELNTSVSDYTPMAFDRGKPEKIGRNAVWRLGSLTVANLFHFGANEKENHWLGIARAGIQGMHNSTYGRICLDGPQYLKRIGVTEDPYMIVISSNYWDAMHWSYKTAGPPRKKVKNNTPGVKAGEDEPETEEWQVDEERPDRLVSELLARYVDDIRDLVDVVKRCYPKTRVFCWQTSPLTSTDSRNPHWFDKRPHVVAALNSAGRFVAKEKGICLLDWAMMFQGRSDDRAWVPDGLHPAPHVSREFMNIAINVLMSHQGKQPLGSEGGQGDYLKKELMMMDS